MPGDPPTLSPDVIEAARAGDERAWAAIYADIAPRLTGYLRGMQQADIDDVIGDTFVSMVRSFYSFSGAVDDLRAWAYAIARNARLDAHRRDARHARRVEAELQTLTTSARGVPQQKSTPGADAPLGERSSVVALLSALTERQREVMLLRIVADLTVPQIAYVMDEQIDAIKQLQRRATKRLREQRKHWEGDADDAR